MTNHTALRLKQQCRIDADELTEGDIIWYKGDISSLFPSQSILILALLLMRCGWRCALANNIQTVAFAPNTQLELTKYQSQLTGISAA